jgi:hypothetical protein
LIDVFGRAVHRNVTKAGARIGSILRNVAVAG